MTERTHFQTSISGEYRMSAAALAAWAQAIAESHEPSEAMPEATVRLPGGITFAVESSTPIAKVILEP